MEPTSVGTPSSGQGLRWLDRLLQLVTVVFVLGTLAFLAALGALVSGNGGVAVDATLERPFVVSTADGETIEVRDDGEIEDRARGLETAVVRAKVRVSPNDRDARAVLAVSGSLLIAAFWIGLVQTRQVVRSARKGRAFDVRNVRRLRVTAALFVAVPAGAEITRRLVASTVDAHPSMQVSMSSPDWGVFVLVALFLVGLAEIFREGVDLRDFEESTV